jgi:uncharacterized protein (UPF0262 family)
MTGFAETDRLARVHLEQNRFQIVPRDGQAAAPGPYDLGLGMAERMLVVDVRTEAGEPAAQLHLSLSPLRGVIKDYFAICESYFDAVKRLPPSRIEAIDMGRRGIHDEGARILSERLDGKIRTDHDTARRLFTVICALQFRG